MPDPTWRFTAMTGRRDAMHAWHTCRGAASQADLERRLARFLSLASSSGFSSGTSTTVVASMAQLPLAPVQPALQPPGRAVVASASASSRPILAPRQRRAGQRLCVQSCGGWPFARLAARPVAARASLQSPSLNIARRARGRRVWLASAAGAPCRYRWLPHPVTSLFNVRLCLQTTRASSMTSSCPAASWPLPTTAASCKRVRSTCRRCLCERRTPAASLRERSTASIASSARSTHQRAFCPSVAAVDDVGLPVGGIMGTSAGALIGSLYAAGYAPREVGAAHSQHHGAPARHQLRVLCRGASLAYIQPPTNQPTSSAWVCPARSSRCLQTLRPSSGWRAASGYGRACSACSP